MAFFRKKDTVEPEKLKFRNEWKYVVSDREADLLKQRLSAVMEHDSYAENGMYMLRSLYFDDYWDSSYNDKIMGVEERCKWRIRCYNCSDSSIKLERKMKRGSYIHKDSATLTRRETDDIIDGKCEFLLYHPKQLCREFYFDWISKMVRPKVIVDYDREPMIYEEGDVRITFDSNLRAGVSSFNIFDADIPAISIMEPGTLILEVKFTEFLPEIIHKLLPLNGSEFTAVSKYTLCYETAHHLTAPIADIGRVI